MAELPAVADRPVVTDLPATADAVVIGAGLVGAATAAALAGAGLRVCLLDRTGLLGGTSAAGEGNLLISDKRPGPEVDLMLRSLRLWRDFAASCADKYGDIEFEEKGGLVVAWTARQWASLRSLADEHQRAGVRIEELPGPSALEVEPLLSAQVHGAMRYPQDAQVSPMAAAAAFLRSADVTVVTGAAVTGARLEAGALRAIHTERGTVSTPCAVIAAGPWSGPVARLFGTDAPVRPRRGDIIVTEPVRRLIRHKVYEADYVSTVTGDGVGFSTVVEGTRSGTVLIGSSREFVGFDPAARPATVAELARHATRLFPSLAGVRALRTYHGFRPATPDRRPLIGPDPHINGLFFAAGHEGAGIGLAPVTAELVAAQVTGTAPPVDPAPYDPARFAAAGWAA
ncbi:MAG TPA: FAD-dependent oxidoreductase [Mycobacteriales bacterium]|nr:FAD-dependent oxidoreductase [Mycobacteriales bacterium]